MRDLTENFKATELEVTTDEQGFKLEVTTDEGELLVIDIQDLPVLFALERGASDVTEYLNEGSARLVRALRRKKPTLPLFDSGSAEAGQAARRMFEEDGA